MSPTSTSSQEPAGSKTALIVVDMLNRYEHEDAQPLIASVRRTLPAMRRLLERAREAETPIVYVNDNYGDWSAGRAELSEQALDGAVPPIVEPILPEEEVAFLVKARHSVFFETQLDYMLRHQGVGRIVLIGQVTEQCILYSALDAYVRHYSIVIPRDAVAHIHEDLAEAALRMMEVNMAAEITTAADCALG
jgi:nicotinamidase-related amidase